MCASDDIQRCGVYLLQPAVSCRYAADVEGVRPASAGNRPSCCSGGPRWWLGRAGPGRAGPGRAGPGDRVGGRAASRSKKDTPGQSTRQQPSTWAEVGGRKGKAAAATVAAPACSQRAAGRGSSASGTVPRAVPSSLLQSLHWSQIVRYEMFLHILESSPSDRTSLQIRLYKIISHQCVHYVRPHFHGNAKVASIWPQTRMSSLASCMTPGFGCDPVIRFFG